MDFKNFLKTHDIIGLSPMDGVTDEAFRLLQCQVAKPDVLFTEFVSAEGLTHGGVKLYDQLLYSSQEHPIIGQLFGKDPDSFYKSAIILAELGFDGIDINMGCPAKTVTHNGSGAALIAKPALASELINAVKSGIADWYQNKRNINDLSLNQKTLDIIDRNQRYSKSKNNFEPSISVKSRIGINDVVTEIWISHLLTCNLDFITLHGRTLKQMYGGTADWQEIKKAATLAKSTTTKIWGNGDVVSRSDALAHIKDYGVYGVLIGRAALGNPWLFADIQATPRQKFDTMLLHAQIYQEIFPERRFDPLRRYFLAYASGLPNAKALRSKLVSVSTLDQLCSLESEFLSC
jgi:tRNA-dihydrouridine synthase